MSRTCLELCAGGGGMAIGMERAGWRHMALVESNETCCGTLKANRPDWPVVMADLRDMSNMSGAWPDMVCGGPPCQPFSIAGNRMGRADPRDVFLPALEMALTWNPKIILYENVLGLLHRQNTAYRSAITDTARAAGYAARWIRFNCSEWGVPQRRNRVALVCVRDMQTLSEWPPLPGPVPRPTIAELLVASGMPPEHVPAQCRGIVPCIMGGNGSLYGGPKSRSEWEGLGINGDTIREPVTPPILGGSDGTARSHGKSNGSLESGPKSNAEWKGLGVDARSIAMEPEPARPSGLIRLTMRNIAALQGFPPDWVFSGGKRDQYRQIGNALPAPAAEQLGLWAARLLDVE